MPFGFPSESAFGFAGILIELLDPGEPTKQYAVIFYQGNDAFGGLLDARRLRSPAGTAREGHNR
jgi:hypothetical protein